MQIAKVWRFVTQTIAKLCTTVFCLQLWSSSRVSVQGVKSLGGHFACLCCGFDFYEVKKNTLFFKKKRRILFHFSSFSYRKVFKQSKIAQIYYYDPQSAGINVQSPQSEPTPKRLTWSPPFVLKLVFRKL